MGDIILKTIDLMKKYNNKVVVDNLNLEIKRGEIFGLLGPNGAGKSTTISMICSIVRPTAGEIELLGKNPWKQKKDVIHKIGYIPQELAKNFSGGMKRRLNIACALGHNPELLIFDEPTVGIDPQSRNFILDKIKESNRKGTTVIYTSHYMAKYDSLFDKK